MAVFPEDPAPKEYEFTPVYNTLITAVGSGNEQRKRRWSFPKYNVAVRYDYDMLDVDDMQILWNFYNSQSGAFNEFYVFDQFVKMNHYGQYVGVSNGTQPTYDIPGRETYTSPGERTLWITSITGGKTERSSNISWGDGTGEGSGDQVTFTSSIPAEGELITIDFYGYLRARVRFERDDLTRGTLLGVAFSMGIALKGLKPE